MAATRVTAVATEDAKATEATKSAEVTAASADDVTPDQGDTGATDAPVTGDGDTGKPATPARKAPGQVVIGPVAVLPLVAGGERYVYRGAPITDEFTKDGVKHAVSVGLVGKPTK